MSVMKNDIPILEYDSDPAGVIAPDHENLGLRLPRKAVLAFPGKALERYAEEHAVKVEGHFESATRDYPVYIINAGGQAICLMQAPVGAPAAAQILDWLISYGVREVISCGCCGALEDFDEDVFLVPCRALRDEGTSYHYLPPARFVDVSPAALNAIERAMTDQNLLYREVTTWSTDGFYRETKEKVECRRSEGCSVVEMECAALAACAKFRGAVFGEILFTADTLADTGNYDERGWGRDSAEAAIQLGVDSVLNI